MKLPEIISSLLDSRYGVWLIAALSALVFSGVVYAVGGLDTSIFSLWVVIAIVALVAAIVFAFLRWGIPRWQAQQEALPVGDGSTTHARTNFLAGLQELYRVDKGRTEPRPWYLLIGESGSGKTAILRAATFDCLTSAPAGGRTRTCEWWASPEMAVLDTTGRYSVPEKVVQDTAEWETLLQIVRKHGRGIPIEGIILTIAADVLVDRSAEQLRSDANKLRQSLEKAIHILGIDFPVYVIVTKCDLLEGFRDFFAQLSDRIHNEAIGYIDAQAAPLVGYQATAGRGKATLQKIEIGLRGIYDRLHFFRLSLLSGGASDQTRAAIDQVRAAIFCFPEELNMLTRASDSRERNVAVQGPLLTMLEEIFGERVRLHPLLFRGIFFTSSEQRGEPQAPFRRLLDLPEQPPQASGPSKPYFLKDLFERIIPGDQSAFSTTTTSGEKRRSISDLFGSVTRLVPLLLFFLLGLFILRTYIIDRRLVASVDRTACVTPSTQSSSTLEGLKVTDRCRQVVESLIAQNGRRSWLTSVGFRRSFRLARELQQQYLVLFKASVLKTLDENLERTITKIPQQSREDPLPLILTLARRVRLLELCKSTTTCDNAFARNDDQPEYSLLLNPRPTGSAPLASQQSEQLRSTYRAYLLWQQNPSVALQDNQKKAEQLLQSALSPSVFNVSRVLQGMGQQGTQQISYKEYWGRDELVGQRAPQVSKACTKDVWVKDLRPILQRVQGLDAKTSALLTSFEAEYVKLCLTQWSQFLARFPSGAERWTQAGQQRELALLLLSPNSPYKRVIEAISGNAESLHGEQSGNDPSLAWVGRLQQIVGSPEYKAYQEALTNLGNQIGKEFAPEVALNLAREAFAETTPTDPPTHPILAAWSLAGKLSQTGGTPSQPGTPDMFGQLFREPVRSIWQAVLQQSALALQTKWQETLGNSISGSSAFSPEQFTTLYGPSGQVQNFVDQFLRPFVIKDTFQPIQILGAALPLSPTFLTFVKDAQQLKPVTAGGGDPQQVQIKAVGRSKIENAAPFAEQQTILSITCGAAPQLISNVPAPNFPSSVTIAWTYFSCSNVSLVIHIVNVASALAPEATPPQPMTLRKEYSGPNEVLRFFSDFIEGSKRLAFPDFVADPGIQITVHYSITMPAALKKIFTGMTIPHNIVVAGSSKTELPRG